MSKYILMPLNKKTYQDLYFNSIHNNKTVVILLPIFTYIMNFMVIIK
jgi:hypothetical protein